VLPQPRPQGGLVGLERGSFSIRASISVYFAVLISASLASRSPGSRRAESLDCRRTRGVGVLDILRSYPDIGV